MAANEWAHKQLSALLPLDSGSITQILDYTSTLPKDAAAEHLKALLGDSARVFDFISLYNARRRGAAASSTTNVQQEAGETENDGAPNTSTQRIPPFTGEALKRPKNQQKKKAPLHQLPSRKLEDSGNTTGGYQKGHGEDYIPSTKPQTSRSSSPANPINTFTLSSTPVASLLPRKTAGGKPPPSASGFLISDLPNVRTKSAAASSSRTASPAPPKAKVSVPGGVAGKGASTTLEDLVRCLPLTALSPTTFHCTTYDHNPISAHAVH